MENFISTKEWIRYLGQKHNYTDENKKQKFKIFQNQKFKLRLLWKYIHKRKFSLLSLNLKQIAFWMKILYSIWIDLLATHIQII